MFHAWRKSSGGSHALALGFLLAFKVEGSRV